MKLFNTIKEKFNTKVAVPVLAAVLIAVPQVAHAAEITPTMPDMGASLTTAISQVVSNTLSAITAIAPIGITIFGAMFVWKKGLKFFNQTTK